MKTQHEILEGIRQRFIGSAEEHECLKTITTDYHRIYQEARQRFDDEHKPREEFERRMLALAYAYVEGNSIDGTLLEVIDRNQTVPDEWQLETIVRRLKTLGVTEGLLATIVEKFNHPSPGANHERE